MLFLFRSAPEVEKRIHSKLFRKFWRSRGTKEPAYITVNTVRMGSRYLTASISPLPSLFSIFQESELVGDPDLRQIPPGHLPVTDSCPQLVSISKRDNHSPTISPSPPCSSFIRGVKQKHFCKLPYLVVTIHCLK